MKIHRLPSHPDFGVERSRCFGAVWEVELDAGEMTQPHQHEDLEEIYYFLEGAGEIVIAKRKKLVGRGEVIYVPRLTSHWLENNSPGVLRCLTIESRLAEAREVADALAEGKAAAEVGADPGSSTSTSTSTSTSSSTSAGPRETIGHLDTLIGEMPAEVDQVTAIKQIVALFDIGGRLSEQIEEAFGLDNDEGVQALSKIERKIMDAVVEITRRYERKHRGGKGGGPGPINRLLG